MSRRKDSSALVSPYFRGLLNGLHKVKTLLITKVKRSMKATSRKFFLSSAYSSQGKGCFLSFITERAVAQFHS